MTFVRNCKTYVRNDQMTKLGYEIAKTKVQVHVGTKLPNQYELTWVQNELSFAFVSSYRY